MGRFVSVPDQVSSATLQVAFEIEDVMEFAHSSSERRAHRRDRGACARALVSHEVALPNWVGDGDCGGILPVR